MSEQTHYPDLTPAQFEFEIRDHRKMEYNEYLRFQEERKKRKIAFEQAQTQRSPLSRWWHAKVQYFRERRDDNRERELQNEITPNCYIQ